MSEFVKEIGSQELGNIVNGGKTVLIDFFATWCGPCKMLAPVLDKVAAKNGDVTFVKVDIDKNADAAEEYGVQVIPTLVLVKDGKVAARTQGFMPEKELESFAKQ